MTTRQTLLPSVTKPAHGRPIRAISRNVRVPRDFVPKNFEEMYRECYTYVQNLLRQNGIEHQDCDDVAQSIFMTLDKKGFLDDFNPDKALFSTFLTSAVLKYLRHYRHRKHIRNAREGQSADQVVRDRGVDTPDMWIDVYGPHFEEEYSELHGDDFRRQIRTHLASVDVGRKDNQLDLVALFDEIDRQVIQDGKYTTAELGRVFSVSRTTVHNWLDRLRREVAAATADD